MNTAKQRQGHELDIDSLGQVLGPGGLHEFLDQAIVQPVLQAEAGALARQEKINAELNETACISPKGHFAIDASFDAFSFHDIVQHEGVENVGEDELQKDLSKRAPVVVRSRSRRSSIIVPASKYKRIVRPGERLQEMRRRMGTVAYGRGAA